MMKKFILVSLLTTTMATQSPVAQAAQKKLLTLGAIKQSHAAQNPKKWSLATKIALGAGAITGATVVAIAAYCYAYGINPMDIASQSPEWLNGLYDYLREFASSTTTVTPTVTSSVTPTVTSSVTPTITPCPSLSNGFPFENLSNHPFNFGTCSATSSVTPTVSQTLASATPTVTQTATATFTDLFSQAANQTISATQTISETLASASPSVTQTISETVSQSATETATETVTNLFDEIEAATAWCTSQGGEIVQGIDGDILCRFIDATSPATSAASRFMDGLASGFSRYNPANWNLFN